MYDIVPLVEIGHEPRVDSRLIAEQLGIKNINVRELIEKYSDDFSEFGQLRFQTEVGEREQGGGNPEKYALLNEDQAYLLLTYAKNTEEARTLKKRLVRSFGEHRHAIGGSPDLAKRLSERGRRAALPDDTARSLRRLCDDLHIPEEPFLPAVKPGQPHMVDVVALAHAILDDITRWRYPYPFAFGFGISGRATVLINKEHAMYHIANAPHFQDFFQYMSSGARVRIEQYLTQGGPLAPLKKGPVIDDVRMNCVLDLEEIGDALKRLRESDR